MKAAIYARYSTAKQRNASIADQIRNCESYIKRQGWTIVKRYKGNPKIQYDYTYI